MLDLLITGGRIIDGSGGAATSGDVGIRDGRIVAVGRVDERAQRTVDADGALVTPGFVDVHTHYDGQVCWDEHLGPSSLHGVTTVVLGNCGVGFAPVRSDDRTGLMELMEGVEDIPGVVLDEGIPWEWTTFSDYLDYVDGRRFDIDVAVQVPHAAVRYWVMGADAGTDVPARPEQRREMAEIVAAGIEAGAMGFSTSRTVNHRTSRGANTPTLAAGREELLEIARRAGQVGRGVFQLVSDFVDRPHEMETIRLMSVLSGLPVSMTVVQSKLDPEAWRLTLADIEAARAAGADIRGQVGVRATGALVGLQATLNPVMRCPTYQEVDHPSLDVLVARLSRPEVKAGILAEYEDNRLGLVRSLSDLFLLGDPPDYEPGPERSVTAIAAGAGKDPVEALYDLLLEDAGRAFLYLPLFNYAHGNLDAVGEMLRHPHTVPALSDGGAHLGTVSDGSFPTFLLTHWGRDRRRGELMDVEWLVKRHTSDTAEALGFGDRGRIGPGYKADINVIDFDRLGFGAPYMANDLPAGGRRLLQDSVGYVHTFVGGEEIASEGRYTGATPGRLVRSGSLSSS